MIYLAMYKGRDRLFDRTIQYWTNSPYSHCELVVNGVCYSSSYLDKGVRSKSINYFNNTKWDLFEIPWASAEQILRYYEETKHYRYSLIDLVFTQLFKTYVDEEEAIYCSAWCAAALGLSKPNLYNPDDLVSLIKDITWVTKK